MRRVDTLLASAVFGLVACSPAASTDDVAQRVKCTADHIEVGLPTSIPVQDISFGTRASGNCQIGSPSISEDDLDPARFSACVYGKSRNGQSFLMMTLDDVTSVIYDFEAGEIAQTGRILNIMHTGDIRFQCWLEP